MPHADSAQTLSTEKAAFHKVLSTQFSYHPRLEVQDLYKLVFQAALGSEHAILDNAVTYDWLTNEIKKITDKALEPIVEPISPDGRIARINLRPYIAADGDLDALLDAFVRTANEHHGTAEQLQRYWYYAVDMATAGHLLLSPAKLRCFFTRMRIKNFPAVHHSANYKRAYHPAYRVVFLDFLVDKQQRAK